MLRLVHLTPVGRYWNYMAAKHIFILWSSVVLNLIKHVATAIEMKETFPKIAFPVTIAQPHFEAIGTNNNHKGALKSPMLTQKVPHFQPSSCFPQQVEWASVSHLCS